MAKVFKFLTPRRALPFFNSPRLSDFQFSPSQCCCCCRFGAEKLKTMRIPLAALLRLEWTYFSLPSLVFFLGGSPCFFFFCIIKKVLYIFCWYNGGVGVYLHLAVGCVKRLALLWRRGRQQQGKEAWLVKKLAAGAEIFNTLLPCRTDNLLPMGIPQEEGERERE